MKLESKITGTIIYNGNYDGNQCNQMFINHGQFPNDPNKVISILSLLLEGHVERVWFQIRMEKILK